MWTLSHSAAHCGMSTSCASVFSPKLVAPKARPMDNMRPCECGKTCPALSNDTATSLLLPMPIAMIISNQHKCFERARAEAIRGGFDGNRVRRVPAEFVDDNETVLACCPRGKCGQGRRSKPSRRSHIDGIARAHRRAWKYVVAVAMPAVIFEDDIEYIGEPADSAYAVRRCLVAGSCDAAYLGVAVNSWLLSHAYLVTPRAASLLLNLTREQCNFHGQDYTLQALCTGGAKRVHLDCHLPPRGAYRRDMVGWGLFVQNQRRVPSYMRLVNDARGHSNYSREQAENFMRC